MTNNLKSNLGNWCKKPNTLCRLMLPLLMTALLLIVQPADGNADWQQNCGVCHCYWNSGKKTADCKNKFLSSIPSDLSNELQVVDMSNNVIPELRREEFEEANLQNLHKIYLRNCTIQELNRDALKGLQILIELDMSHNSIRVLHPGTFSGLVKLRILVMNNNEIEVLDNYLFADLHFLSRVEFKNNRLKLIEMHAFGQLPMLSAVYLETNALTVLRKETFSRTPKLMDLSLSRNPWNCTCELQEFRDFAIANRLYTPPTECSEPSHLRGKLWNEVPSDNFACQPRILGSIRSFVEAQADNITLPCRIAGAPRPNVTWVYNKRPINQNDNRFKILNSLEKNRSNGHVNIFTSELRINGVRTSDKGTYTCVADNRGGIAEAEFQLLVNSDYFSGPDITGEGVSTSSSDSQSNILLLFCLIAMTLLLLLIIVVLVICWYCRRIKTYQKDSTMMSENNLISSKIDKTHNASMLEGSVIMEMQKSLLTEVNPVVKPPRRTELESVDGCDDGHEINKTLLDETQYGHHHHHHPEDETHSIAFSDTTTSRSLHTFIDESYGTSLPPDLLAFPARVPPTSPSMQSSQSNIPDQINHGIRSPPSLTSPVYTHMTPHGIYGSTTIAAATPNGFMTLQHPKSRNLALIAAANSRQQQSPFIPAPVLYSPANAVVMKQGYMTIPRKPRVPSWAPSTSTMTHSNQQTDFQSPISPNPSETGTAATVELLSEPVYDNLGLRTTAGGNSTLNLHKVLPEQVVRYTMRDRPLPATPSFNSVASNASLLQQQMHNQPLQQYAQQHQPAALSTTTKIYEPIQELLNQHQIYNQTTSDTEPLYGTARHHTGLIIVPNANNATSGIESKSLKIPPRPPPKPKKKICVATSRGGQGSTSQLFDDEGEDGTEV